MNPITNYYDILCKFKYYYLRVNEYNCQFRLKHYTNKTTLLSLENFQMKSYIMIVVKPIN